MTVGLACDCFIEPEGQAAFSPRTLMIALGNTGTIEDLEEHVHRACFSTYLCDSRVAKRFPHSPSEMSKVH